MSKYGESEACVMRRRGRGPRNSFGGGLFLAVLVLVLAVATGYAGTRYIVAPYLLNSGNTGEKGAGHRENSTAGGVAQASNGSGSGIVAGKQDITELTPGAVTEGAAGVAAMTAAKNTSQVSATLYSLQFGSFSTEAAAVEEQKTLQAQGISSYIVQKDNAFKVLGMPYLNKDTAKSAAGVLKPTINDVFVSTATVSFTDEKQKESLTGLLTSYAAAEQSQDPGKAAVLSGMQGPIITMMEGLMK